MFQKKSNKTSFAKSFENFLPPDIYRNNGEPISQIRLHGSPSEDLRTKFVMSEISES